jgi:hypothetical protein
MQLADSVSILAHVEDKGGSDAHDYLAREAKSRVQIDKQLADAGWPFRNSR